MTRALVWKELREQWTSAVAVLALAAFLFLSMILTADPSGVRSEYAITVLFCMTWVAGLVAGIQPLAAERESGTLGWLDALPVTRRDLFRAKAIGAGTIAAAAIVVIAFVALAVVTFAPNEGPAALVLPVLLVGLNGFCCGLFGSAVARTALGAFGWALAAEVVTGGAIGLLTILFVTGEHSQPAVYRAVFFLLAALISLAPLFLSRRHFTRLDRLRGTPADAAVAPASDRRAVAWLTWRQGRVSSWLILGTGLAAAAILAPVAPHLWPMFGLLLGVLAGTGTFGADQQGQARQFFGDRRLPPATVWWIKSAVRFAPLAVVLVAYYAIGFLRAASIEARHVDSTSRAGLLGQLWFQYGFTLVCFGPVTGFAWGLFVGMVVRKEAVAAVIAFLSCVGVGLAWLPSLVNGGVQPWQWLGPPLLLIVATRLAYWPWATGRIAGWKPATGLLVVILLAVLGTFGGIAYRIIEVPVRTPPFDVAAFEASFPKPEQNEAGRAIQQAIRHFQNCAASANEASGLSDAPGHEFWEFTVAIQTALADRKWPADSPDLDKWLDATLDCGWVDELRQAVTRPLGVVDLGGRSYFSNDYQAVSRGTEAGTLILARGLRRTSRGEVGPAFDDFALVLDYCRNLRKKAPDEQFRRAAQLEVQVADILPDWAVKTAGEPDLLRRAIEKLRAHDAGLPPVSDTVKLGYLTETFRTREREFVADFQQRSVEQALGIMALRAPWEQYRNWCIEDMLFAGLLRTAETTYPDALRRISAAVGTANEPMWILYGWTPPPGDEAAGQADAEQLQSLILNSPILHWPVPANAAQFAADANARTRLRAAQLQLALIQFQAKEGKPAGDLAALVPSILPSLPADPFGDGPFKYRLSRDPDRVIWNARHGDDAEWRDIKPGEGVLWSVGIDLQDDGGRENNPATWRFHDWRKKRGDILFVVPAMQPRK
jgi:hypothetical protein